MNIHLNDKDFDLLKQTQKYLLSTIGGKVTITDIIRAMLRYINGKPSGYIGHMLFGEAGTDPEWIKVDDEEEEEDFEEREEITEKAL